MRSKMWFLPVSLLLVTVAGKATPLFDSVGPFNVVAFGNYSGNSDVGGRVAIGGNLTSMLTVNGNELNRFGPYAYTTIVNGNTTGKRIQQNTGGSVFARGANPSNITIQNGTGQKVTTGNSPFDFTAAEAEAVSYSSYLARLSAFSPTLGKTQNDDVVINPQMNDAPYEIFRLTADQFSRLDRINTGGKTIIIDVLGTSVSSPGTAYFVDGQQANAGSSAAAKVLFNFSSATNIEFRSSFYGTLLAPSATLTGNHQINGQFIVNNVKYNGQIHGTAFAGDVPVLTPEPGTLTLGFAGVALLWLGRRRMTQRATPAAREDDHLAGRD